VTKYRGPHPVAVNVNDRAAAKRVLREQLSRWTSQYENRHSAQEMTMRVTD
jgi:hypothetical protein